MSFFLQAKDWVNLFCSLGNKRTGYGKKNVTCYMHSMVYHLPEAIKRHTNVKQFTGQGTTVGIYISSVMIPILQPINNNYMIITMVQF